MLSVVCTSHTSQANKPQGSPTFISLLEPPSCGCGQVSVAMPGMTVPNGEIRNPNVEIRNKFKSRMFKSETTRACVTTSKLSAPQGSFCHLDFGHLVLFRISDFVLRICAFYGETTYPPLWGVSSRPSPSGDDYLVSHPKTAILGRS